ncbi:ZIP family metal transporter [Limnobacter sp.]|uniref:ZIP family metal transporter n=1 Tax=Limnobacter sp. TaxID=2003368 RepID=UPI002FE23925
MDHHNLFTWLLAGLLFFFVLEKFSIFRHSHHHEHDGHDHHHGFDKKAAGRGGFLIVVGDSIHNFADGLLIASAFLVDEKLGMLTTLSIVLHEIPQQTGDFLVLVNAGLSRAKALKLMAIAGLAAVAGAGIGYTLFSQVEDLLPIALVLASASFLYVAVADLIPQMQQRLALKESALQLAYITGGVVLVAYLASILHHQH